MKKRILSAFCLLLFVFALPLTGWTSSVSRDGYFGKIRLSGKVRIVEYNADIKVKVVNAFPCLLYTSPSPRDAHESRMPSSA